MSDEQPGMCPIRDREDPRAFSGHTLSSHGVSSHTLSSHGVPAHGVPRHRKHALALSAGPTKAQRRCSAPRGSSESFTRTGSGSLGNDLTIARGRIGDEAFDQDLRGARDLVDRALEGSL